MPVLPNESTDREKRQARVNNLRTTWLNSSIVIVSWDHPDTGPPELYYRFVHAAIIVSDGTSNVSHDSFTLDRLNTSITLSSVDRNHLHIFHVNAVYQSSVFSRIYLEGRYYVSVHKSLIKIQKLVYYIECGNGLNKVQITKVV